MAKTTFITTTEWQQIAEGVALITILKRGRGTLFVNESATETDASRLGSEVLANDQLQQFSEVPTHVKHNTGGTPWVLLVDIIPEVIPAIWLDSGAGGINNPWNDSDIWSE